MHLNPHPWILDEPERMKEQSGPRQGFFKKFFVFVVENRMHCVWGGTRVVADAC